jgi:hypothetical protein
LVRQIVIIRSRKPQQPPTQYKVAAFASNEIRHTYQGLSLRANPHSTPVFTPRKLSFLLCAALLTGCRDHRATPNSILISCQVLPTPARIGAATAKITLTTPAGSPVTGAHISLEVNMAHPGMAPTFGTVQEAGPGVYLSKINFDMAGDWTLQIRADVPHQMSVGLEQPVTVTE